MRFRMVDRIVAWEGRSRIAGAKTVSFEEYWLKSPFGDEGRLPESLLLESMFQLGNWLIVLSTDFTRMGLLVRVGEARFSGELRPGRRLDMELEVVSFRDDGVLFDGRATSEGVKVVSGKGCLATPVPLEEFHDSANLRVLFSEIYRPRE